METDSDTPRTDAARKKAEAEALHATGGDGGYPFVSGYMTGYAREMERENATLRRHLKELHAMVWGECPSLLNEDSGGCGRLDVAIRDVLATHSEYSQPNQKG